MRTMHLLLVFFAVLTLGCTFDPTEGALVDTDDEGSSTSTSAGPGPTTLPPPSTSSGSAGGASSTSDGSSSTSSDGGSTESSGSESSGTTGLMGDYALAFDSQQSGVTEPLPGLPMQYTIEFELRTDGDLHGAMLSTVNAGPPVTGWFFYQVEAEWTAYDNALVFIDYNAPGWDYLVDGSLDVNDQPGWHHVAVTKDNTGLLKLYFDGTKVAETQRSTPFSVVENALQIGAHLDGGSPLRGAEIDNVRISSGLRYEGNFDPPTDYDVDATSLYLWLFDEGDGDVATDEVEGAEFDLVDPLWMER